MFKFAFEEIASKYTLFWDYIIYNIIFTCYKHCDWDRKVKNAFKEDKYDISVYLKIIYFFSFFAIHSPYISKKFGALLLGYGVGIIFFLN